MAPVTDIDETAVLCTLHFCTRFNAEAHKVVTQGRSRYFVNPVRGIIVNELSRREYHALRTLMGVPRWFKHMT